MCVRTSPPHEIYDYVRMYLVEPNFAYVCTLIKYVCLPIFIRIVNDLDLHFKCKRFESSTLAISYMIMAANGDKKDKHCYCQQTESLL